MRVDAEMLRAKGICEDEVATFEREWPHGVEITREGVMRTPELCLDLEWFAKKLLSAPALATYKKAEAIAWKAYRKALATALAAYEEVVAPAEAACEEATAPAVAAYKEVEAPAVDAYEEGYARAKVIYEKTKTSELAKALGRACRQVEQPMVGGVEPRVRMAGGMEVTP